MSEQFCPGQKVRVVGPGPRSTGIGCYLPIGTVCVVDWRGAIAVSPHGISWQLRGGYHQFEAVPIVGIPAHLVRSDPVKQRHMPTWVSR